MITIPKQAITQVWHQQFAWRTYTNKLFGAISRRSDFTTEFRQGDFIAGVLPEERRLLINPALLPIPQAALRFDPQLEHLRRSMLLRAIVAHEAGHVAFSAAKPTTSPQLGQLWNILEDERMERLVIRRFPELCSDFDFLGDVLLHADPLTFQRPLNLQDACLVWRWMHDHPDYQLRLREDVHAVWHSQARALVEAAWETTRENVAVIAQQLLDLLPDSSVEPTHLSPPSAGGAGMSDPPPQSDPAGQPAEPCEESSREEAQQDQAGTGQPDDDASEACEEGCQEGLGEQSKEHADASESTKEGSGASEAETTPPNSQPDNPFTAGSGSTVERELPTVPQEMAQVLAPEEILEIEGYARQLSTILAPAGRPASKQPHRSRGQFRYDRYQQGAEKYFSCRVGEDKPKPFLLRLLIDTSFSMAGPRLESAKQAALMLCRAAYYSRSRVQVITFDTSATELVAPHLPWEESKARIHGVRVQGGTFLASALRVGLSTPPSTLEKEVVALICDGQLDTYDVSVCQALLKAQPQHARLFLPVLIGEATEAFDPWLTLFGCAVPVTALEDIAQTIKSSLINLRQKVY